MARCEIYRESHHHTMRPCATDAADSCVRQLVEHLLVEYLLYEHLLVEHLSKLLLVEYLLVEHLSKLLFAFQVLPEPPLALIGTAQAAFKPSPSLYHCPSSCSAVYLSLHTHNHTLIYTH